MAPETRGVGAPEAGAGRAPEPPIAGGAPEPPIAGGAPEPPIAGGAAEHPTRRVDKPWGHELIWAETDRYVGKTLVIDTGKRLSLQYHERKDETILVISGRLRLYLGRPDGGLSTTELGPGEHRRIPVGTVHRYEAIERCEVAEVSTPELDDVVRLEDDYGREGTSAP